MSYYGLQKYLKKVILRFINTKIVPETLTKKTDFNDFYLKIRWTNFIKYTKNIFKNYINLKDNKIKLVIFNKISKVPFIKIIW